MGHPIAGTGDMWVATFGAVVTHVGFVEATGEGRSLGLVLHLLETSGLKRRGAAPGSAATRPGPARSTSRAS